jgi:hypothetical protein
MSHLDFGSKSPIISFHEPEYRATDRITMYKPAEHEEMTSVAPLLQFFESVHIGDTIQSMVQIYFDKAPVCVFFFSLFLLSIC